MSPSLPLPSFHTFCVVRRGRTTARDGLEVRQYGPGRYRTGQRLRSCMAKTSLETNCCNPDPAEKCLSHCARLTRHVLNSDKAVATLIQLREKQEGLHASQGLDIITKLPAESGHYSSPQMTASPTVPAAEVLKIQGGCPGRALAASLLGLASHATPAGECLGTHCLESIIGRPSLPHSGNVPTSKKNADRHVS